MTIAAPTAKLTAVPVKRDANVVVLTVAAFRDYLVERSIQSDSAAPVFAAFDGEYDLLEKDAKGQYKRVNKTNLPFVGQTLIAETETSVLLNLNYEKAVEKRSNGEQTAAGGNWQQAFIVDGKLTPLTIHKGDVKTFPKEGATPKADGSYAWPDLEAVISDEGSVIVTSDNPRVYLRTEFRSSKKNYFLDGKPIDADKVKPWLKKSYSKGPVAHHTVTLANVKSCRIDGVDFRIV